MVRRRILAIALVTMCGLACVQQPAFAAAPATQPRITNIGVGVSGGIATFVICVEAPLPPAAGAVTVHGPRGNQQAPFQAGSSNCGPNTTLMQATFPRLLAGRYLFQAACVLLEPDSSGNAGPPVPCLVRNVGFVSNFKGLTVATTCQVDFDPSRDMALRSCASPGTSGTFVAGEGSTTPSPTTKATPEPTRGPSPAASRQPAPVVWTRAAASRAFFAEGYTGSGYQEYVSLLNPRPKAMEAAITLYRTDGATRVVQVKVPGLTRSTLDVNALAPHASTALRITASGPLVAERALYVPGGSGHIVAGAPLPARQWYVAEGYVGKGFADGLRVFNPYDAAARLEVTAYDGGGAARTSSFTVSAGARLNIALDDIAPTGSSSVVVASSEAVVVESVIQLLASGNSSGAMAVTAPSATWYFPDASTQPGDQAYVSMFNPGTRPATARMFVLTGQGIAKTIATRIGPHARATVALNTYVHIGNFATIVQADRAIVAQEVRYTAGGGASLIDGVTQPAHGWGLAEGYAGGAFREWVTLVNPGPHTATATVRLVGQRGYFGILTVIVAPHHQHRLSVNGLLPQGSISAVIQSDQPIVAGRTLLFDRGQGLSTTSAVAIG